MNTDRAFDLLDLRQALGTFATGVAVVTTRTADGRLVGLTVNSFSTVSLTPAIVLWSLQKTSPNLPAFDEAGRFVINILSSHQIDLSRRFASPAQDKFSGVSHQPGIACLPMIDGCAAVFQCQTIQRHEVGDHVLYLGQVDAYTHQHNSTLLFHRGRYEQSAGIEYQPA